MRGQLGREADGAGACWQQPPLEGAESWATSALQYAVHFASDIRYALRLLKSHPGFVFVIAFSLAVAIGINTAVFSVSKAVLYQHLDVPNAKQLRLLGWRGNASVVHFSYATNFDARDAGMTCDRFSYPVFRQLQRDHSMAGIFAFWDSMATASIAGIQQQVRMELVSDNYYQVLGVRLELGRPITNDHGGAANDVAVISDELWDRQFGRSPSALGQMIVVNHTSLTIIGVNPRGFTGAQSALRSADIFVPLSIQPQVRPLSPQFPSILSNPNIWLLDVMGRLKARDNEDQVRATLNAELAAAVRGTLAIRPDESVPQLVSVDGSRGLHLWDKAFRTPLDAIVLIALLVLLLATVNVANLTLVRGMRRQREIAIRVALGANRGRVVRQLLTESFVLAAIGGCGGLLLGFFARNVLPRLLLGGDHQNAIDIHFDWRVCAFAAALTILSGVVFGLAPVINTSHTEAVGGLQIAATNSPKSWTRGGKALVMLQISMSALLLMGAALFVRTLLNLDSIGVGFPTDHLLLATIDTPREGYPGVKSVLLHQRLQQAIAALPGVEAATALESRWFSGDSETTTIFTEDDFANPSHAKNELISTVDSGFFSVMGIPLVAGRPFAHTDNASAPRVAIVNQALAKERFASQSPVGKRFAFTDNPGNDGWVEIIGVAGNTKYQDLREPAPPQLFVPLSQQPLVLQMTYVIRSPLGREFVIPELRHAVASVDPTLHISDICTQQQQIDETTRTEHTLADLTSGFGFLALILVVIGIYGIMLYSVEQRQKEIGIRLALGAQREQVRNRILWETARLAIAGIGAGLLGFQAFTRILQSILYGVSPRNPVILPTVAALLLVISLAAAWLPAQRAASVVPMEVLRQE